MKNKLKSINTFILVIIFALCIALTQLPGIYAYPTKYADYNGLIISENDDLQQIFVEEYCYSFRTEEDSMERPFSNSATSSAFLNTFIAELINSGDGTVTRINNYNNPYPDIQIPEDSWNNETSFWNYIFTISKYWKIYTTELDYYGTPMFFLKPYNYIEPEYKIECNPKQITPGEISKCTLKANYHSKIKSINFKLDTSDYTISDVKSGEDFENLEIEDNLYSLTSKDTLEDSEEGKEIDIITFNIKSNSETIVGENNIKVLDIVYEDGLVESPTKTISETVKQEKKDIKELITNPKTRNNLIIILALVTGLVISIKLSKNRRKEEEK